MESRGTARETDLINTELWLGMDKENMDSVEYTDSAGNAVRFHAANKEFYKIDRAGMWIFRKDKDGKHMTKRNRTHRFQKDATPVDRMVYLYEKAESGEKKDNWFAEYIKMAKEQAAGGVNKDCCIEHYIATTINFCWGVQTLRTQINLEKNNLIKRGVSAENLKKIPTLKVMATKPRPTFSKQSSKWTSEKIDEVKDLLAGL
tara:strand:+ start:168 stop:776 length:609 start_codon:yes stop_codon:yes gene_type:complete